MTDAPPARRSQTSNSRSPLFLASIVVLLLFGFVEAVSYVVILLSPHVYDEPIRRKATIVAEQQTRLRTTATRTQSLFELDSLLGWRFRPGFASPSETISIQGLRSSRAYAPHPPDSVLRVAAFGDSFVFSSEVDNANAWPAIAERLHPGIEVLNYGVGGYGSDQAYLRFLAEGAALRPHVALFGFVADDLRRLVNVYRPYVSTREWTWFKPRYILRNDTLELMPNPAPTAAAYQAFADEPSRLFALGAVDQWYAPAMYENPLYDYSASVRLLSFIGTRVYRRYLSPDRIWEGRTMKRDAPAFRLQAAIFEQFVQSADSMGIRPVLLFFPDRESVRRIAEGKPTVYANLVAEAAERGLPHLDAIAAFDGKGTAEIDSWFASRGHYSAKGNELVAQWLVNQLGRSISRKAADVGTH